MTPFVCSEATFLTGETNIGWLTKIWCWKWPAIDGYTMLYIISPWSPIIITSHRSPFANRLATHLGGPCSRHTPKLWIWKRDSPKGLFMTWHDPFRVPHGSGTQGIVWNRVPLNPLVNDLSLSLSLSSSPYEELQLVLWGKPGRVCNLLSDTPISMIHWSNAYFWCLTHQPH